MYLAILGSGLQSDSSSPKQIQFICTKDVCKTLINLLDWATRILVHGMKIRTNAILTDLNLEVAVLLSMQLLIIWRLHDAVSQRCVLFRTETSGFYLYLHTYCKS